MYYIVIQYFSRLYSIESYYKILVRFPITLLLIFILYMVVCISYSPTPNLPLPSSLPKLVITSLFSISVNPFLYLSYSFVCFVF